MWSEPCLADFSMFYSIAFMALNTNTNEKIISQRGVVEVHVRVHKLMYINELDSITSPQPHSHWVMKLIAEHVETCTRWWLQRWERQVTSALRPCPLMEFLSRGQRPTVLTLPVLLTRLLLSTASSTRTATALVSSDRLALSQTYFPKTKSNKLTSYLCSYILSIIIYIYIVVISSKT